MPKCPCKPGDKVTCLETVEAYYSEYGGRPECFFRPGTVGIVSHVDTPSVRPGPHGEDVRVIVDFRGPAFGPSHARHTTWRVALCYRNVKLIERVELTPEQSAAYSTIAGCSRSLGRDGVPVRIARRLERFGLATIKGPSVFACIGEKP
jgi:hypothetical protein